MPETTEPTLLDQLREQRGKKVEEWANVIAARETARSEFEARLASEDNKPTDADVDAFRSAETAFKADSEARESDIRDLDERIRHQEDVAKRRADAAAASSGVRAQVTSEPLTYRRDNAGGTQGLSYYRDLALANLEGITFQTGGTRDQAISRLQRHAREMEVEMPKRAEERAKRARDQFEHAEADHIAKRGLVMRDGLPYTPFEQRVTPNVTQGQGGYMVPPLWLIDEFIPGLRAHLIAAGLCRQLDLPAGTDSINIPKLAQLTKVGYQQANNSGLPSQDWTDTAVQANVKTVGGYSDVALQLLEQSPIGIVDEVITRDMMADYNRFLDGEVLAGDGLNTGQLASGHLLGIYPANNWSANTVTYTDGSPAPTHMAPGVFGPVASKVARTRFDMANFKYVLHGRRWFYYSTGLDVNGRPIGETLAGGGFNLQAAIQSGLQAEGLVGRLPYVADAPVYIDDNVTTVDGDGTRDVVIGGLWDDAWLFQGEMRTDVFKEVLSGTLGVRFRAYNYAAFLIRYGQSFAIASGTGLTTPSTGYGDNF